MHRICLISLAVLLILALPAQAQEGPSYRLRVPSAAEYLAAVPPFIDRFAAELSETADPCYPASPVAAEIRRNYPEAAEQDYALVEAAYDSVSRYCLPWVFWKAMLIGSWLNTNQIDLDATTSLEIRDFAITVTPADLTGDGLNEWVLFAQLGGDYEGYLVFWRAETGAYRPVEPPLPLLFPALREDENFIHRDEYTGTFTTSRFEDVNADGQNEWIVTLEWAMEPYGPSRPLGRRLFVLGWREDALVDLGGDQPIYLFEISASDPRGEWVFSNLDGDLAQEIDQRRITQDNWSCEWTQSTVFDWNGTFYVPSEPRDLFPETPACRVREAEAAMWAGDYEQAIVLYEGVPEPSAYAQIRLALAYAMNGRETEGIALLQTLRASPEPSQMGQFVDALIAGYEATPTPLGLCLAAYTFLEQQPGYVHMRTGQIVGITQDNFEPIQASIETPLPPSSRRAGCDAPLLIERVVAEHTFPADGAPVAQLEALGIPYAATFAEDLNGDGQDEWLVWTAVPNTSPIFFAAENGVYHTSHPPIFTEGQPGEYSRLTLWRLPGDAGTALVVLDFNLPPPSPDGTGGLGAFITICQAQENRTLPYRLPGTLEIWRFEDGQLQNIFTENSLCWPGEMEDFFPGGEGSRELQAWHYYQELPGDQSIPTVFTWDDAQETYILPALAPSPTPTVRPTPAARPSFTNTAEALLRIRVSYDNRDDQAVIDALPNALAQIDDPLYAQNEPYLRYLGALAFEALSRPDEALAEYVAVYEAAPESAWGMLAALHLEVASE